MDNIKIVIENILVSLLLYSNFTIAILSNQRYNKNRGDDYMPTICMFRGIKIYINWRDHMPPHFHATYGGEEVIISINDLEVIDGDMPNKQLKMLLGWAAFHQDELIENWNLASKKQELFAIEPLR